MTFIHGIGNKLPADPLLEAWERALAVDDGVDLGTLGITSEMVYWADVLYPEPKEESFESTVDTPEIEELGLDFRPLASAAGEREWIDRFAGSLGIDDTGDESNDTSTPPTAPGEDEAYERVPLPRFVKRRVLQTLLTQAVRQVAARTL